MKRNILSRKAKGAAIGLAAFTVLATAAYAILVLVQRTANVNLDRATASVYYVPSTEDGGSTSDPVGALTDDPVADGTASGVTLAESSIDIPSVFPDVNANDITGAISFDVGLSSSFVNYSPEFTVEAFVPASQTEPVYPVGIEVVQDGGAPFATDAPLRAELAAGMCSTAIGEAAGVVNVAGGQIGAAGTPITFRLVDTGLGQVGPLDVLVQYGPQANDCVDGFTP